MRLRAIRLQNFRQHADTTIEFSPGITGIIGPNGTGKTTILEAIAWALYGNEAARGRRDGIRFVRAEPKAQVRVELDFDLAGHRYRVVRGLTSAELYLDGAEQPIANSLTSVSETLQRRLGMSRSEFFNTYFSGQKELSVMTSLGPTERGQFLSRVLGYERLRLAQDLVRDTRKDLIAELTGLRQAMPNPDVVAAELQAAADRVTETKQRLRDITVAREHAAREMALITPRWELAQRDRALFQQAAADLRIAEFDLLTRTRDAERVAAEVAEIEASAVELAALAPQIAPVAALMAERETLDVLQREEGRREAITASVKAATAELAALQERQAQVADAPRLEEEAVVALDAARGQVRVADEEYASAHARWASDRQEAQTKLDQRREQYRDVKQQRDKIVETGEHGECPICERSLGTHFRTVLDSLDTQLTDLTVDGNYYKGRVEQLKTEPSEVTTAQQRKTAAAQEVSGLERRVATAQAAARDLSRITTEVVQKERQLAKLRAELATLPIGYDRVRHETVRLELVRLAPLQQRATQLSVMTDRAASARGLLVAAQASRDAAIVRTEALRAAVAQAAPQEAAYDDIRRAHERAADALGTTTVEHARAEAEAAAAAKAGEAAQRARDELARNEQRLSELTKGRRMHDELDQAFADLRTDLNFSLRPELSELASDFLAQLTDGRYTQLDLDDQYNLVIVEDNIPKPVISGGEEDLANLVLRLAISQMIAERAGQQFSLLILDEVFGSLDDARRQNVVELLRALHDRFEQVILITHIDNVRDGCDNVIMVRFDPNTGSSVVSQGDAPLVDERLLVAAEPS